MIKQNRIMVFARFVKDLASLSKCSDRSVACILTSVTGDQVYSIGINGGPSGGPQCLCKLGNKYTCIHAEANAVAKCSNIDGAKLAFCTLSPCVTCASLLINAHVKTIFYIENYKENLGLQLMRDAGIDCIKLEV